MGSKGKKFLYSQTETEGIREKKGTRNRDHRSPPDSVKIAYSYTRVLTYELEIISQRKLDSKERERKAEKGRTEK